MRTAAVNYLLAATSYAGFRRWEIATQRVAQTQREKLFSIIQRNVHSSFGRAHDFTRIATVEDYRARVPIRSYEDFAGYFAAAAMGERGVLTEETVHCFTPTSGSVAGLKLIPYTASLKREFQAGIGPWLFSLARAFPRILAGPAYWSITPVGIGSTRTAGGIPIGFDEDSEYFGPVRKSMIGVVMAVPELVAKIQDPEVFRYVTLRLLVQARRLAFVSVWNPTFLGLLLRPLREWGKQLAYDLAHGTITPPGQLPSDIARGIRQHLRRDGSRAAEILRLCREHNDLARHFWPSLAAISAWADGPAAKSAETIRDFFPHVPVQPKGLVATEGIVSFPLGKTAGSALAITSHFLEFEEVEEKSPRVLLAHELAPGKPYTVILTTGGGLYRYRLYDHIEVMGYINECPRIRFLGKDDSVSDLCGEKLHEEHVRKVIAQALATHGLAPTFTLLAPERDGFLEGHYTLFLQFPRTQRVHPASLDGLAAHTEEGLSENFHYAYCRKLGQLSPVRVSLISHVCCDARDLFLLTLSQQGKRLGNIKPNSLSAYERWAEVFHVVSSRFR